MRTFRIFRQPRPLETLAQIIAPNHLKAAEQYASSIPVPKSWGRGARWVIRQTGYTSGDGVFQAYKQLSGRGQGSTSIGEPFNVQEVRS